MNYLMKEKLLEKINNLLTKSPGSKSIDISDLSSNLKKEFTFLIPGLKELIRDGSISIHSDVNPRQMKSSPNEIETQIKLLNDSFIIFSDEYNDVLTIKDGRTISISINHRF